MTTTLWITLVETKLHSLLVWAQLQGMVNVQRARLTYSTDLISWAALPSWDDMSDVSMQSWTHHSAFAWDAEAHFLAQKNSKMASSKPLVPNRCETWLPICFLVSTVSSGLKHVDEKILDVFWYHNYETQEWDEQFDFHLFLMNEKSNGMACNSGEVREWRFGTWMGFGDAALEEHHMTLAYMIIGLIVKTNVGKLQMQYSHVQNIHQTIIDPGYKGYGSNCWTKPPH